MSIEDRRHGVAYKKLRPHKVLPEISRTTGKVNYAELNIKFDESQVALERLQKLCKDEQVAESVDAQNLLAKTERLIVGEQE